jgi:hypothetical protein
LRRSGRSILDEECCSFAALPLQNIFTQKGFEECVREETVHLATLNLNVYKLITFLKRLQCAEVETGMAENSSWDQANRRQKLGLVWRNRKKISQIIKDYFYLLFFFLIILW